MVDVRKALGYEDIVAVVNEKLAKIIVKYTDIFEYEIYEIGNEEISVFDRQTLEYETMLVAKYLEMFKDHLLIKAVVVDVTDELKVINEYLEKSCD